MVGSLLWGIRIKMAGKESWFLCSLVSKTDTVMVIPCLLLKQTTDLKFRPQGNQVHLLQVFPEYLWKPCS